MKSEWKTVRLGDVLAPKGYIRGPFGSALKRGELLGSGIPVYEQQHAIYDSRIFRFFIDDKKFQEMKRFQVRTDDLIISCSGTLGRVSVINENDPKGIISQALLLLRVNKEIISPTYFYYFLTSRDGYNSIVSRSSGSVQVNIAKRETIEQIELDLPPLPIQQTIANTLSALDDKIANNKAINNHLEQMAQAIFKSWFVDFEPWGGEMPEDWREGTLDELCSLIVKGITPKYDDNSDQIVINQKCIRNRMLDLTLARRHNPKTINNKWLRFGDILINSTGEGTLGRAAMFLSDATNVVVDSHVTIVRPREEMLIPYLGLWCLSRESLFASMSSGSTGQTDLPRERLKLLSVLLPSSSALQEFANVLTLILQKRISTSEESLHLATIRDTLLPRLMSGELSIAA